MGAEALPRELLRFIAEQLHTSSDLDVLFLLHRQPDRGWDALGVAGELRIHRDQVDGILTRMAASGLLRRKGAHYWYAPATAQLGAAVTALAALHPTYRVAIANVIFSSSRTIPRRR